MDSSGFFGVKLKPLIVTTVSSVVVEIMEVKLRRNFVPFYVLWLAVRFYSLLD